MSHREKEEKPPSFVLPGVSAYGESRTVLAVARYTGVMELADGARTRCGHTSVPAEVWPW